MSTTEADRPPLLWATAGPEGGADAAALAARAFDPHFREAWTEAQISGLLATSGTWLDLGRQGPSLVAFALSRQSLDEVELLLCAVAPDWRGRGVGRRMMERVAASARARGARRLFLEVRASNAAALALYRGVGFQSEGVRPAYYRTLGGETIDAITLSFRLNDQ